MQDETQYEDALLENESGSGMQAALKRFFLCLGAASLILVTNYGDLLGGGADVRMHVPYRLTGVVCAQVADIAIVGFLLFLLLTVFRRTRAAAAAETFFAILIVPLLLERTRYLYPFEVETWHVAVFAVVWAATVLLLRLRAPLWYRRLFSLGDALGIFLAIFAACSIAQMLALLAWRPGTQKITAAWDTGVQPPRQHARIVWILFDELSYDQVFEHRAADLALPNFDALRSQSTVYTQIQSIGLRTVKVVPSLLSGAVVDDLKYRFNNRFLVRYAGRPGWMPLDGSGTVFGDAHRAGWRTAVVGWYNPYCTIYADALDSCFWSNLDRTDGDMAQTASFARNTLRPLSELGTEMFSPERAMHRGCESDIRTRKETFHTLEQHALEEVRRDQSDFVFLHLPVPHTPNIWNRKRNTFTETCDSSYLDNLALADLELGRLLKIVRSSPRWNDTTVIVQGDHSWRTMIWDGQPSWTEEDDRASHGAFDPRPALLVHAAGQTLPQTDNRSIPLVLVHDVIEGIVRGEAAPR